MNKKIEKEEKIPRIIHYCWFGSNPLPEDAKKCIESWKKYCPNYEIKEWNESNFDLNCNTYVQEAYKAKKWAFVTDYVRLYVTYTYGGIYMDTDVEVLKPLDKFLKHKAFSGFESSCNIPTGIMASEKNFPLYKEFLKYYMDKKFILKDGSLDMTTNVTIMTNICNNYGLIPNNSLQEIKGWTLYPSEYFCPKDWRTGEMNITKNTYTIHHFSGSWLSKKGRENAEIRKKLYKIFGKKISNVLIFIFCHLKNN